MIWGRRYQLEHPIKKLENMCRYWPQVVQVWDLLHTEPAELTATDGTGHVVTAAVVHLYDVSCTAWTRLDVVYWETNRCKEWMRDQQLGRPEKRTLVQWCSWKPAYLRRHSPGYSWGRTSAPLSDGGSGLSAAALHRRSGWDATAACSGSRTRYHSPPCHIWSLDSWHTQRRLQHIWKKQITNKRPLMENGISLQRKSNRKQCT